MGLHKGNTNNPNGRPKGSKNIPKLTDKEKLESYLNDYGYFRYLRTLREMNDEDFAYHFTHLLINSDLNLK